jgi:hypothetical protein
MDGVEATMRVSRTGESVRVAAARRPPGGQKPNLGALLLENLLGFLGGYLFFAVGPGNVAQGSGLGIRRAKLPERNFSAGVRVGCRPAANQRSLGGQGGEISPQRMVGKRKNLWLVGKHGDSSLSEGRGGT